VCALDAYALFLKRTGSLKRGYIQFSTETAGDRQ